MSLASCRSIPCISESMFTDGSPSVVNTISAVYSTDYINTVYGIATSDSDVSGSLIQSQLDDSLSSGYFTSLLQQYAIVYNATGLTSATSSYADIVIIASPSKLYHHLYY